MGETEEAEWVLEKLSMTLEKEMKKLSEAKRVHPNSDSNTSGSDKTFPDKEGDANVEQRSAR